MIQILHRFNPEFSLIFSVSPMQTRVVEFDGRSWSECLIDRTCEMTVNGVSPADCAVWLCGGGGGGGGGCQGSPNEGGGGGGGGRCGAYTNIRLASGSIVIGAGGDGGLGSTVAATANKGQDGGVTRLSVTGQPDLTASGGNAGTRTWGGNGGSGGGQSYYSGSTDYVGLGAGATTIPFGDGVNWARLCAGGGGASPMINSSKQYLGGAGGSNGGNGKAPSFGGNWTGTTVGGEGGATGGGNGGNAAYSSPQPGGDATYYGGGGGGGSVSTKSGTVAQNGGAGYKGCVIIRVPTA
ncbi:MAG: hypothetical protein LBK46_05520 [Oscillospiraceae bacterium]|jgi:hypothetical protein|nr:hypothetical protein [Oscillospiraceae bacterium]